MPHTYAHKRWWARLAKATAPARPAAKLIVLRGSLKDIHSMVYVCARVRGTSKSCLFSDGWPREGRPVFSHPLSTVSADMCECVRASPAGDSNHTSRRDPLKACRRQDNERKCMQNYHLGTPQEEHARGAASRGPRKSYFKKNLNKEVSEENLQLYQKNQKAKTYEA